MTSRGPTAANARFETVCGQRLRVSVEGPRSSPPLLLIGGIGAPLELWGRFREALARTTIAFDTPGCGASPAPWRPRSMFELAHLVLRLLDRLEIDTVDVLGISWGGGLAQHVALLGRRRVRRLVLAATGFGLGSIPASIPAAAELLTPARYSSPQRLRRVGPKIFGGETRRHPEILREHAEVRSRHAPSRRGYIYQLLAAATWASLPWLPLVRAETLLLYGDDDPIVNIANGRVLRHVMPYATLDVVPGAGHLFLIDQPDDAVAIVDDFLSAPRRADRRPRGGGFGPTPQNAAAPIVGRP
jgi:pimeloyl-ACP methyl ester carboxylesterase